MSDSKLLPTYLVERYQGWKSTSYAENESRFRELAKGQSPKTMVISCCDSRVHPTAIFDAEQGELFVHRNIANFVPPYDPEGDSHGTSAAIEYAVTALKVSHIVVLGHSSCGGVAGCEAKCSGNAPQLEETASFVGRWVEFLRPGYERIKHLETTEDRQLALEKEAIVVSLENLHGFPFVANAEAAGALSLHGLYTNIGAGSLEQYVPGEGFAQV